jgi:hypothetical protein
MRALGRAAASFVEDGYTVFLDGVIGPWFLPALIRELPPGARLEYVVLQVALDRALERVRARQGRGASTTVAHMHRAFSELGSFAHCALDTSQLSTKQVVEAFLSRREQSDFVVLRESLL